MTGADRKVVGWPLAPKAITGIPHPIPYQGSKRQLARMIVGFLPPQTDRLIEPFAGSAAVSIAAAYLGAARRFWLNDAHAPLMALWREIIGSPQTLASDYKKIWTQQLGDERNFYDVVRQRFNGLQKPEDFLYLLARCVKAAIRYNSKGQFNNSPDNRRKGARPETMERHIQGAAALLRGRTELTTGDYAAVLRAATPHDVVYMDPPYQGVCNTRDHRYAKAVHVADFIDGLTQLNARAVPFIISYDGRTGDKTFGQPLPRSLGLEHIEVRVGRSTQATLLGRNHWTYESLYLSPALPKVARRQGNLRLFPDMEHEQPAVFA